MNERDMYYNSYGYAGGMPGMMPNFMGIPFNNMMPFNMNGANSNNNSYDPFNEINNHLNKIDRQIKRLDQRLSRLETPYGGNTTNIYNEPDSSMYML